ncbi:MAG: hypothetical protein EBZ61_09430 [Micrococcales bacterium]|nr:hypothetical protein [Micrococcales bacterium]
MSLTEWWSDPSVATDPAKEPKLSKVDKFKKEQDNTKVGKAEQAIIPKVMGAIEAGSKKPILGRIINPAMSANVCA